MAILLIGLGFSLGDAFGKFAAGIVSVAFAATAGLAGAAWMSLRRAWKARPSDLVIDRDGFAIRGGALDARRFAWTALTGDGCRLDAPAAKPEPGSVLELHRLVAPTGGGEVVLAIAERPDEVASLEEVARTLRGAHALAAGQAAAPAVAGPLDAPAAILACPTCAAPAAPADVSSVTCPFCSADVPVPDALRERVRVALDIADRPDAEIAALLDQPSARTVGGSFVAGSVLVMLAWPVALGVFWWNLRQHAATFSTTALLLLFVAAVTGGVYALLRSRLVDRIALRLVLLDFGADAPAREGEPYRCRQCAAPLPARPGHAFVRCAYCKADNVLGVALHREHAAVTEQRESLAAALARRAAARRRLRGIGALSLLLLALSGWALPHGLGRNARTWPLEQRCNGGDLDACTDLGELLAADFPKGVRRDVARGATLLGRACDAGHARACDRLADLHTRYVRFPGTDRKAAPSLRREACDRGYTPACHTLGELHRKGDFAGGVAKDPAEAERLLGLACDGGIAESCFDLGLFHDRGEGVTKDATRAVARYRQACDLGSAVGCNNLGVAYQRGEGGVPVDVARARELYQQACDAGYELGCRNLRALASSPAEQPAGPN
jgi:TPR repeat protein